MDNRGTAPVDAAVTSDGLPPLGGQDDGGLFSSGIAKGVGRDFFLLIGTTGSLPADLRGGLAPLGPCSTCRIIGFKILESDCVRMK